MKLFIFSYPSHYRLTKLAAYYAERHVKGVSEIIYVWDDFHTNFTVEPNLFGNATVLKFSDFKYTKQAKTGWLRQQFVKLQLHTVTSDESIYVLDGDTIIRNDIDLSPDKLIRTFEYSASYFNFIKHSLKLIKRNTFSFISPLLRLETQVLVELENYCRLFNNGKDLIEIFLSLDEDSMNFSEAEIYGTFATQILNKQFVYQDYQFVECWKQPEKFVELYRTSTKNLVWCGIEDHISSFLDIECSMNS